MNDLCFKFAIIEEQLTCINIGNITYDKDLCTTQVDAPDSKQSRTYYDEAGRVTSRRDYLVADTTYVSVAFEYDNNSQVTVTTDQNTNEWTKTYDAMGRHITTVTPTVSSTEYTNTKWYDGNGNVAKVTDFNGADTTYTYNNSNQRTQISYIGAGGGGGDIDIDFDYNCCRMTGYDDTLGSGSVLVYDEFARLTSHTDSQGYELQYEYDSMNRVTKVTDHTSIDTEFAYDLMGRTSTVTYDPRGANRVTTYTYDGNSNVATATYANSYKSTFTYDAGNRTTQQKIENAATPARVTYHPTTSAAGNTSTVYAKGSYSVINGSAPVINSTTLHSELFYHRNTTVRRLVRSLSKPSFFSNARNFEAFFSSPYRHNLLLVASLATFSLYQS